jgi:hypothetical protein
VNGGYNILMAYNTLYRVGRRSHGMEIVFGGRTCDGNTARCSTYLSQGGWGTTRVGGDEPIPNRNVHIYNNLLYNPPGFQSQWQHFAIYGSRTPTPGSNIPSPARTDTNLQIRGNLIWNGPADLPLGIEGEGGCQAGNATCYAEQLRRENTINTVQPQLVDPARGNFRPVPGGNVFRTTTYAIPDFTWVDAPVRPAVPAGTLENDVPTDRDGRLRAGTGPAGAYVGETVAPVFSAGGRVSTASGAGIAGVTLRFGRVAGTGAVPLPVTTDTNGAWSQAGFQNGTVYRVLPVKEHFVFTPAYRDFSASGTALSFSGVLVPPPAAPTSLAALPVTGPGIRLTWRDNSTNESGFRLERHTGTEAYREVARPGVNATSFTDTGVQPGTRYVYRLRAVNAGGFSTYSNEVAVSTAGS